MGLDSGVPARRGPRLSDFKPVLGGRGRRNKSANPMHGARKRSAGHGFPWPPEVDGSPLHVVALDHCSECESLTFVRYDRPLCLKHARAAA